MPRSGNHCPWNHCPFLCHPERSQPVPACRGGICSSLQLQPISDGSTTLPLSSRPERSGAEGPAVLQTLRGNVFSTELVMALRAAHKDENSRKPQLCHLDRSEAEWRDLRFAFPSRFFERAQRVDLRFSGSFLDNGMYGLTSRRGPALHMSPWGAWRSMRYVFYFFPIRRKAC